MKDTRMQFTQYFVFIGALTLGSTSCQTHEPVNHAPGQPAITVGPSAGVTNSPYTFTSVATDSDGDSVCYRFSWDDGDTSGWTDFAPSGYPGGASHSWSQSGTFVVRTQAKDDGEAASTWSDGHQLMVTDTFIRAPRQLEDYDSAGVGEVCWFSSWSEEQDTLGMYSRFYWGDGSESDWAWYPWAAESFSAHHAWNRAGTYEVRAQVKDHVGHLSFWSDPGTVHVYSEPRK